MRSAKADRLDRVTEASAKKIKSPPKHENNVLLQSLVKHIEEEKLRKKSDYGVIAATMKARSAQYPWLKRGILYHLMSTLDSLVSQIIFDMGYYSPGKQVPAFKKSLDVATKDQPHLAWLDETFVHFLFKQEYSRYRTTPPPPQSITSPPQITRVLPTQVHDKGQPSERTFTLTEGSTSGTGSSSADTSGTGSSSAASSSNNEPHSSASSLGEVAAQAQQTLNMGGGERKVQHMQQPSTK
jgi:hypothetical protein